MLTPATIAEIRRLTNEGFLSQREIAERLGISRHAVRRATLRKPAKRPKTRKRRPTLKRCPKCGGKIEMPCRACKTQAWMRKAGRNP